MSYHLDRILTSFGDVCELSSIRMDAWQCQEELEQFKDDWKKFNPDKPQILRDGLSVTSLDGKLTGYPDLHSLKDVWDKTGKSYTELDFNVLTDVYHKSPEVQKVIDPWKPWLARCHFLRLPQGGHFPAHYDGGRKGEPDVFRIIVPIVNCLPPTFFMKIKSGVSWDTIYWTHGRSYYVNTTKRHVLFNASGEDTIMLILNIKLTEEAVNLIRHEVY
tara:strand:+ start:2136 stop:2786 length:651 start_codon:yes stop_codon:yes gene_type:complete